jgi:hypothetical protein
MSGSQFVNIVAGGVPMNEPRSLNFTADNVILDVKNDLVINNTKLNEELQEIKESNKNMKQTIEELKQMITEIYYAPNMPGYFLAKKDFENQN